MNINFRGRHFKIYFNPSNLKYYIKDMGSGKGCFLKIKNEVILKNNTLISIGDSFMVISYNEKECNDTNLKLNIKVFSNECKNELFCFDQRIKNISIGRSSKANVFINDSMLSRIHCSIIFQNNNWILRDGCKDQKLVYSNMENGKIEEIWEESTNGTWIYLSEETEIENNMIFKANDTLFTICKIE